MDDLLTKELERVFLVQPKFIEKCLIATYCKATHFSLYTHYVYKKICRWYISVIVIFPDFGPGKITITEIWRCIRILKAQKVLKN